MRWTPDCWRLDFVVHAGGAPVGVQTLEAQNFLDVCTVDSGSWLTHPVRGKGVGLAMRRAVLALAFGRLGALAAVSSARADNAASLGVSRRIGFEDDGVSLNASGRGLTTLRHVRLTAQRWRAPGQGDLVTIEGFEPCRRWFGVTRPVG